MHEGCHRQTDRHKIHVNVHLTITMITVPFDNVPGYVCSLLGEDGLRLMAQLINNIYTTEQWQKECNEVTITALKGKHRATKCIKHHTVTTTAHAAESLSHSPGMSVIKADHQKNILSYSLIQCFDIPRDQTAYYVYSVYHKGL
jgi:hypothetical protein